MRLEDQSHYLRAADPPQALLRGARKSGPSSRFHKRHWSLFRFTGQLEMRLIHRFIVLCCGPIDLQLLNLDFPLHPSVTSFGVDALDWVLIRDDGNTVESLALVSSVYIPV